MGPWYCDVCGKVVELKKAYVIWTDTHPQQPAKDYGFKIIHQGECDLESHGSSLPLHNLVGSDGIVRLLAFLSPGRVLASREQPNFTATILDFDEYVDLFHRVQTPNYEEARRHFARLRERGHYDGANEVGPYLQRSLTGAIAAAATEIEGE